ncbi:hypothetical protein ABBQ32_002129 [Trebouxia sp. C0010 RCD-2024]
MSVSVFGVSRQGVATRLAQRWSALVGGQAICLQSAAALHVSKRTLQSQKVHRCSVSGAQLGQQINNTNSVYSNPELYDRAFSLRDFAEEVDFLNTIFKSCVKTSPGSFLELGCGPARHTAQLQLRTQAKASALDNVPQMLEYARTVAEEAGASVRFMCEDMRSFTLQEPADMAFMLLGTFSHMLDNASALQCLRSIHAVLKPTGKLVLELSHPTDIFDGSLIQEDEWDDAENRPSGPGVPGELAIQYGSSGDEFDPIDQVIMRTVQIYEADNQRCMQRKLREVVPQRIYTYQEMDLLASMGGFKLAAAYGDMQIDLSIRAEDAARMVLVLERL